MAPRARAGCGSRLTARMIVELVAGMLAAAGTVAEQVAEDSLLGQAAEGAQSAQQKYDGNLWKVLEKSSPR